MKKCCSKRLILIIAAVITLILTMQLVSAQTVGEAADELQQRINYAWKLLKNTHVSESGTCIPIEEYWATQEAHTELQNAIAKAQAVLDLALPGSLTIIANDITGMPVHYAEIDISVDNVHNVHQIQNGVIVIPNIPTGSTVRFRVYAEGKSTVSRTISDFNPGVHSTQIVALEVFKTTPMISAGIGHTLALHEDGTVWAWGSNSFGQLGDNTVLTRRTPVQVQNLNNIIEISAGIGRDSSGSLAHSVALRDDGTVLTWGSNEAGKLGDGTFNSHRTPVQVDIENVIAISAGSNFTVALKNDGTVWAWGNNQHGRLGNGSFIASRTPVQVQDSTTTFLNNVIAISTGNNFTIALKNDGTVWGWGDNNFNQLGDGNRSGQRIRAIQVHVLSSIIAIASGDMHSIALDSNGRVWTWGWNTYGQLGNGTYSVSTLYVPFGVQNLNNVTAIAAGGSHTAVVVNNDSVMAWGQNQSGQLGINSLVDNRTSPTETPYNTDVVSVAAGINHTVALRNNGSVWSWGGNGSGQLGNNTTIEQTSSIRVLGENAQGFLMLTLENVGISSSPETLDFGSLTVGYSQLSPRTVTITNISNTDITLNALPSVPNWTLTPNTNWTEPLAPNATHTFTIHPDNNLKEGNYNATIIITGSDNTSTTIRTTFTVALPQPPALLRQPSNVTVEEGATASFMVIVVSDPEADYRWQVSTDNGTTWSNVLFAGSSTYTIQNVSGNLSGNLYRVAVSNINGITYSNTARLIVNRPSPISIRVSTMLNRGDNEWWINNLHGSTGRRIEVEWNSPAGATGSVQVFAGNLNYPFITHSLATGAFDFAAAPGVTYRIRFFVNTNSFFQTFSYTIVSSDP